MTRKLSKHQLRFIVDIMNQSLNAGDEKSIILLVERLHDIFDFKAVAVGLLNESQKSKHVFPWITSGYEKSWVDHYRTNQYEKLDPILHYGMQTEHSFTWATARKNVCIRRKGVSELLEAAKDFNVYNGLGIICRAREKTHSKTIFAIQSVQDTVPFHCLEILQIIAPHVHEAFNRAIANPGERKNIKGLLSDREIEVLKWTKEGKTSWEIGCILKISERTVKFHFSNIFKKLNVVNRSQAVATGMSLNFI